MKKLRIFTFPVLVAAALLLSVVSIGAEEVALQAAEPHPDASGTLTIEEGQISLDAEGLEPNSVYTVWLVDEQILGNEVAGAGQAPYEFRTDAEGKGSYQSSLSASPFGEYDMVMVMLHPDGDPANMENMVDALVAEVPEQ